MYVNDFLLEVNDKVTLKVTIWEHNEKNIRFYTAKYINIKLDVYQNKSYVEQKKMYGIEYMEEDSKTIIKYFDKDIFIKELKTALPNGPRLKNQIE